MQRITPCLWFDNQAEEAAKFYTSLFPNSKIGTIARYGESGAKAARREVGSVMTITYTLDGHEFMGLNGGPMFTFSPAVSFFVMCDSVKKVDDLWNALSRGGTAMMPLDKYPWSERYGWLNDRFGVSWQLICQDNGRGIAPALLFVGGQAGKAEEAITIYQALFPNSRTDRIMRYEEGEGDTVGLIKHSRFTLDGQMFVAMDSTGPHKFDFNQAVSFIVNCKDQAELDRYWDGLSSGGGKPNVCGWLSDKYGIPWQIVPEEMSAMMKEGDAGKMERVMAALLKMTKLDIAELRRVAEQA
jgi:predicted 3-demethylubiquinone-9 3-methyltransferase (glyoxalase superfamily)